MIAFLLETTLISLSGVMALGPVTAVAVGKGTDSPYAGALVALGHGIVELPVIALVTWGLRSVLQIPYVETVVFALGGAMLLYMGVGMVRALWRPAGESASGIQNPIWAGVLLSATSPYFLLWWATVGATLVSRSLEFGPVGVFALALTHWSCDLGWCYLLSAVSYKGGQFFGKWFQQGVFALCGVFLLFFGGKYVMEAVTAVLV